MKKTTAAAVLTPEAPPVTQAELDKAERVRLTFASLTFLERVFPGEPYSRRWLEVCAGDPDAIGGDGRETQLCNWHPELGWTVLQNTRPRETPSTLGEWLSTKRHFTTVRYCPALSASPSDGSPKMPLHVLWATMRVPTQDHKGSGGSFQMVDRTKLALARRRHMECGYPPSFIINSGDSLVGYWALETPTTPDIATRWLSKMARLLGADMFPSVRGFLLLPGQFVPGVIPRREITMEEASGHIYSHAELHSWLGEGVQQRSIEDLQRDSLIRARAAGAGGY